ncbi:MAG: prolyl oligopeptidase family serine peptidase, partial [Fimbriimonadales bacterium]
SAGSRCYGKLAMMLPLLALAVAHLQSADIPLVAGVGVSGVTQGGRAPAPIDTVQALIVAGKWKEPHAGDKIAGARGAERTWTDVKANKDGVFEGGPAGNGYVDIGYDSDAEKPMLLQASGDTMVYINGVPRAGDPYNYGYLKIPFLMKKGHNEFLFSCGRGSLKAGIEEPLGTAMMNPGDVTSPDFVDTDAGAPLLASIPVMNCSGLRLTGLRIQAEFDGYGHARSAELPPIEPFSVRKCAFQLAWPAIRTEGELSVRLELQSRDGKPIYIEHINVHGRKPTEHYKRTFVSQIDGSVQYYAVCPALKPSKDNALIMTVHGASVEAIGQAAAYAPKDWCTIVAPTNRRPYGFDWEDWGRMDAMEVWEHAKKDFPHDPKRVILTGHSMGGHGTWTLGLTYPNEFAAIGPSAGWVSFWSYAGGWTPQDPNPVEQILRRSMNSSDTLLMLNNAKMEDVFILHGDKDDNVPVEQARTMKQKLTDIGAKYEYHEEPGAGHWWGNQCVDWPPMFEMFNKARLTDRRADYTFTTVNPATSPDYSTCSIEEQVESLSPSTLKFHERVHSTDVTTNNVSAFTLHACLSPIQIDGQMVSMKPISTKSGSEAATGSFVKVGSEWQAVPEIPIQDKSAKRSGPLKLALQNRMVFVVGTHGTREENEWAANKARFDAESWYYRGNGAVEIVTDNEIGGYRDRNLILYGNADTNSAFKLISKAPMQLKRGSLTIGDHKFAGDDKAALFLYPEGKRLIAVVGGTGLPGLRYTDRLPYFTSGVAYPDWTVLSPDVLSKGSKAVLAAGFFGNDWKFDPKQSAFVGG